MTNQYDRHYMDGTSSGNSSLHKKNTVPLPFPIRPDEVYPKQYLTEVMNLSKDTWAEYRKRGLKKLNTNTKQAFYLGIDIIAIWRE